MPYEKQDSPELLPSGLRTDYCNASRVAGLSPGYLQYLTRGAELHISVVLKRVKHAAAYCRSTVGTMPSRVSLALVPSEPVKNSGYGWAYGAGLLS
jgi:hypothetical protein